MDVVTGPVDYSQRLDIRQEAIKEAMKYLAKVKREQGEEALQRELAKMYPDKARASEALAALNGNPPA
jgi:ribosomal 50S subunit-associated protein YjgA (DUF615 family)